MDSSRIRICFFVLVGVFLLRKVVPCQLPSGRRFQCGNSVSSSDDCPKTCCFDTSIIPSCYFQKNAYGPIQHSNGLCINVKGSSNMLIWSKDCKSRNAFFFVSYDHPPIHVATGKCVLPSGPTSYPGDSNLILKSHNYGSNVNTAVTYRPTENGNLQYYYLRDNYKICIGSKSGGSPKENDYVHILRKACQVDNTCQDALSYAGLSKKV